MSTRRELFGGSITVTLPSTLIDASDFRQVPNSQEVFLYPDSPASIIIEILERVDVADAKDAARFHFDALAHDNSAVSQHVLEVSTTTSKNGQTPAPVILSGTQAVPKFNHATPDDVRISLALYRVESKNVDLVMSMNVPVKAAGDSAMPDSASSERAQKDFEAAAASLTIVDFGLFA